MKTLFLILGFLSLVLGAIGIVTPVLPTTPFLLLSAWSFSKSSPRFQHWLENHPYLSPPIKDWKKNRIIRRKTKILASSMLLVSAVLLMSSQAHAIIKTLAFTFLLVIFSYIISRSEK